MSSFDDILQAMALARKKGAFEECVLLCREGVRLASPETEEWYAFMINLARFLVTDMNSISSNNVEEALKVYLQLTTVLTKKTDQKKRAAALIGLGWMYYLRIKGKLRDNLERAVEAYTEALIYYTEKNDPYTWASIKAALGLIYSTLYKCNDASLFDAKKNYKEALQVFTASEYPEDWKEINDKLNSLNRTERKRKGGRS